MSATLLPPILRPLRDPALAALWGGLATSAVGDQLFAVALAWIAVGAFGAAAGYLTALQAAVVLAAALLGGRWADRRAHFSLMIAADLCRACVLMGVVAVWLARGAPPAWTLVVAVVVLATAEALFEPALQASIPVVVAAPEQLPAVNALLDSTSRIARLLGPGLVAMAAGLLPLVHFVSLDAATFVVSALALALIVRRRAPPRLAPPAPSSALASALRGFAAVRRQPLLFYLLLMTGPLWGAWYVTMFLGIPLMLAHGGAQVGAYGMVIASYGSTNLLATLVVGGMRLPRRPARRMFAGQALVALGTALLAAAALAPLPPGWLVPALCVAAAIGAPGGPLKDVALAVLRQTRLPRADQAAASRAFLACGNLGLLVAFLTAPTVLHRFGAPATVLLCAATMLAIAAVGLLRHRHAEG
jgi:MFS family permease